MAQVIDDHLATAARAGFDAVESDPRTALAQLESVRRDPAATPRSLMVAEWGLGRIRHNAGRFTDAVEHFEAAIAIAREHGLLEDGAEIRISAAVTFQTTGDLARALAELEAAAPFVRPQASGRLAGQRALLLLNSGRSREAVHDFDRAVAHLGSTGDRIGLARTHLNRAVAHMQLGALTAARADLVRGHELAAAGDDHLLAAGALHNLGYLEGRRGDHPAALRAFDEARRTYARLGSPGRFLAALDVDHGAVLLEVGLAQEALAAADRLVHELERARDLLQLGEARLMRTRALLLLDRHADAQAEAAEAERLLIEHDRHAWASIAAYLRVLASVRAGDEVDLASLGELASRLDACGWRTESAEVRIIYGRLALERGDVSAGREQLRIVSHVRRGASTNLRAQAQLARAMLALADGNERAALDAVKRGMLVVERRRASFGSSELRVASSAVGVPLVELGLRLAARASRPSALLAWAERGRAVAMQTRRPDPGDDPELARALDELRVLSLSGDQPELDDRIGEVERRILHHRRLDRGDGRLAERPASAPELREALDRDALVELVAVDGTLHAVVVTRGPLRTVEIGAADRIQTESEHLRFALRRLTLLPPGHPRLAAARSSFEVAADELDRLLLAPLGLDGAAGLVLVPTGALHLVPWSALATTHGRPTTIAPSATRWLRGSRPATGARPTVALITGPELDHAAAELEQIAGHYADARTPDGGSATVAEALRMLESADVAHIAAHGVFRADSPMYSSLRLADGPMCIHDLEGLRSLPGCVVLTACDAGRSAVLAGDELMGTAAALLGLGVGTVVAPVLPVSDAAAARFGIELHRRLAAGDPPAAALGALSAQARRSSDHADAATAAAFQCLGTACAPRAGARRRGAPP